MFAGPKSRRGSVLATIDVIAVIAGVLVTGTAVSLAGCAASDSDCSRSEARPADSQGASKADKDPRPASANWEDAIASSRAAMKAMVEAGETPGAAVAVAVDGHIVWTEGFGYADVENDIEASAETRFGIGSISKTFTMAAVMGLVDDELIDLDAPISTYLSDFPHPEPGITVRRIAVHQSGLSDRFATDHYQTTDHFPTIDAAYQSIRHETLDYEPGTQTVYATGLFTIIGRVVEEVTGKPYLEVMEERVFGPLGMEGVAVNDPTRDDLEHTQFYVEGEEEGSFVPAPPYDATHKLPGAGFLATAADIAKLGVALLDASILSEEARDEMFRPVPLATGEPANYALGLRVGDFNGTPMIHLPGGGIGISSWLFMLPERELVVAVVGNVATAPVGGDTADVIIEAFSPRS